MDSVHGIRVVTTLHRYVLSGKAVGSRTHSHSLPHTPTCSQSLPLTHTHSRPLPLTSTHSHSLPFTPTHFHSLARTPTHFYSLPPTPTRSHRAHLRVMHPIQPTTKTLRCVRRRSPCIFSKPLRLFPLTPTHYYTLLACAAHYYSLPLTTTHYYPPLLTTTH